MNTWLWWLGQNTLIVAVMIPFVLLACRLFRHRPAVQHLLWLVVLLKFLTPPLLSWPWTVQQLQEAVWPAGDRPDGLKPLTEPGELTPTLLLAGPNGISERKANDAVSGPIETPAGDLTDGAAEAAERDVHR